MTDSPASTDAQEPVGKREAGSVISHLQLPKGDSHEGFSESSSPGAPAKGSSPKRTISNLSVGYRSDASVSVVCLEKLQSGTFLEVDSELLRSISLQRSLRFAGRVWRQSPLGLEEDQLKKLHRKSSPAEGYDIFFSHTWSTSGSWKFLSLLLATCWPFVLLSWAGSVALVGLLCRLGLIPMPFVHTTRSLGFEANCPFAPWMMLGGFLASVLGAVLAPHLPACCHARWGRHAFLDGVCIDQSNVELKERGIYGIGGFLSVSKELRVLWSDGYLSSLWCIFELAAYHKANPKGKLQLAPLFVEQAIVLMWFGFTFVMALAWCGTATDMFELSSGRQFIAFLLPLGLLPFLQLLRGNFNSARKLLTDLEHFDVSNARCHHDFDRQFVYSAIEDWYGSLEAFTDHVRGPLRKELLANEASLQASSMPYCLLVATPVLSFFLEQNLALWQAGAPTEVLLSDFVGVAIGLSLWFLTSLKLLWHLCKTFARRNPSRICDYGKTLGIAVFWAVFIAAGASVAVLIARRSLPGSIVYASSTLIILCCCFSGIWSRARGVAEALQPSV